MKVDCNRPAGVFVHVHLGDLEGLRHLAIIVCTVSRHVVSRCAQDLCLAMYGPVSFFNPDGMTIFIS